MFASQIETDTILFKRYYIILEFNIFSKLTVETKTWCAAEKFESDLLFFWIIWFFEENTYKPISNIIILFKLENKLKYMYQYYSN